MILKSSVGIYKEVARQLNNKSVVKGEKDAIKEIEKIITSKGEMILLGNTIISIASLFIIEKFKKWSNLRISFPYNLSSYQSIYFYISVYPSICFLIISFCLFVPLFLISSILSMYLPVSVLLVCIFIQSISVYLSVYKFFHWVYFSSFIFV